MYPSLGHSRAKVSPWMSSQGSSVLSVGAEEKVEHWPWAWQHGKASWRRPKTFVLRHRRMNWGWLGWWGAGSDWFLFHSQAPSLTLCFIHTMLPFIIHTLGRPGPRCQHSGFPEKRPSLWEDAC